MKHSTLLQKLACKHAIYLLSAPPLSEICPPQDGLAPPSKGWALPSWQHTLLLRLEVKAGNERSWGGQ